MKHKYRLGDRVILTHRYTKLRWIDPENDDPRITFYDKFGRASVPRWIETELPKPVGGIVAGVRKITLANWVDWVGEGQHAHWETVQKHLEGQVYIVAVDMWKMYKVAEAWMVAAEAKQ